MVMPDAPIMELALIEPAEWLTLEWAAFPEMAAIVLPRSPTEPAKSPNTLSITTSITTTPKMAGPTIPSILSGE